MLHIVCTVLDWLGAGLTWITSREDLAAWVQAIGTLIAIAVAIAVPWWQHAKELDNRKVETRLKARSLAIAIYPALAGIRDTLRRVNHNLQQLQGQQISPAQLREAIPALIVVVPSVLNGSVHQIYLLGDEPASAVQALVGRVDRYNLELERIRDRIAANQSPHSAMAINSVSEAIEAFEGMAEEAIAAVAPIHDGKLPT
ncbi:hypothetical protein FRZ44_42350 [Hypericibacter terrae]|uniref:Uncharacterized protein n=1 Tax=Hypericibacter terrae TaxID=2602015 RepID=A0A5J6MNI8_9PROT|nr:hypothetical protein [Hypericibacter terrae]QEX18924.1 hypothetical protein FRZ44_42350 [Hypericibacter terrae]